MSGKAIGIGILIIVVALIAIGANGAYTHHVNNIQFKAIAGDYFELSDVATTPNQKIENWDRYLAGLKEAGLDTGVNSVLDNTRPLASNARNYELALDIRSKMVNWSQMDIASNPAGYKVIQEEITWQDYCWFPKHAFYQAYQLKHGGWGAALFPPEQYDYCKGMRPNDLKVTATSKSIDSPMIDDVYNNVLDYGDLYN